MYLIVVIGYILKNQMSFYKLLKITLLHRNESTKDDFVKKTKFSDGFSICFILINHNIICLLPYTLL